MIVAELTLLNNDLLAIAEPKRAEGNMIELVLWVGSEEHSDRRKWAERPRRVEYLERYCKL